MSEQAKKILLYISLGVLFIGMIFLIVGFCLKGVADYSFFKTGMALIRNQNVGSFSLECLI